MVLIQGYTFEMSFQNVGHNFILASMCLKTGCLSELDCNIVQLLLLNCPAIPIKREELEGSVYS